MLPALLCAATLTALALVLVGEYQKARSLVVIAKPLASTGFIALALVLGALDDRYGQAILAALVLSFFGDVALLSRGRRGLLLGMAFFLLAHLAFGLAFIVRGFAPLGFGLGLFLSAAVSVIVFRWLLFHVEVKMRPAVTAYGIVITLMVGLSASSTVASGEWLILLGAAVFYASDISVARQRFVKAGFANRLWGLPAYYVAQLILAATVAS